MTNASQTVGAPDNVSARQDQQYEKSSISLHRSQVRTLVRHADAAAAPRLSLVRHCRVSLVLLSPSEAAVTNDGAAQTTAHREAQRCDEQQGQVAPNELARL